MQRVIHARPIYKNKFQKLPVVYYYIFNVIIAEWIYEGNERKLKKSKYSEKNLIFIFF